MQRQQLLRLDPARRASLGEMPAMDRARQIEGGPDSKGAWRCFAKMAALSGKFSDDRHDFEG